MTAGGLIRHAHNWARHRLHERDKRYPHLGKGPNHAHVDEPDCIGSMPASEVDAESQPSDVQGNEGEPSREYQLCKEGEWYARQSVSIDLPKLRDYKEQRENIGRGEDQKNAQTYSRPKQIWRL